MDILQPVAAIGFVLILLGAVLFFLKRRGAVTFRAAALAGGGAHRLEVLERVPLGPQHALHLVRAGERTVLIATAPGGCHLLDAAPQAKGERI